MSTVREHYLHVYTVRAVRYTLIAVLAALCVTQFVFIYNVLGSSWQVFKFIRERHHGMNAF